jgi:tyrosine-specific transport protein
MNFTSMANSTIGKTGKTLTIISSLFLLYALVSAYVSAGGSLLNVLFSFIDIDMPIVACCLVFTIVFGVIVFYGIKAVDYFNRAFFALKCLLLFVVIVFSISKINWLNMSVVSHANKYLWGAAPIFLCSFGYHILIPVITTYLEYNLKRIKLVLFLGSLFTLIIYISWLAVAMGVVPIDKYLEMVKNKGSVGEFIYVFSSFLKSKWIQTALHGFANITVTTCFLGVSLGLVDFLKDFFKEHKKDPSRLLVILYAFIPPIIFAVFYPEGFVIALGYAAICVAFSHLILPAWMVFNLRKKPIVYEYKVKGGNSVLAGIAFIGVLIIVLQIMVDFGVLPIYGR